MKKNIPRGIKIISIISILSGLSGIVFSFPFLLFSVTLQQGGFPQGNVVKVSQVQQNSPASEAGLNTGDIILSVDNKEVISNDRFVSLIEDNKGKLTTINIERNGLMQNVQVMPRLNPPSGQGSIGVAVVESIGKIQKEPFYQLVPRILLKAYAGYEIKPLGYSPIGIYSMLTNSYTYYQDASYTRLISFISGLILIIISIFLLKLKKWAFYAFVVFVFADFLIVIQSFILYIQKGYTFADNPNLPSFIHIALLFYFVYHLYSKRIFFK